MNTWIKPNGTELELNDQKANVEMALSKDWMLKSDFDAIEEEKAKAEAEKKKVKK